ncbi:hypothetical protein EDD17DRAFT_1761182 [Pisolithus thermaeus]|nr:hypothetical protein EV401DRAFT_2072794 [Pisolithus croceorrhizus]KAI6160405.1 hypothetical protein EDD17DRAFT_1761182 [Pisolithus thermaeus]
MESLSIQEQQQQGQELCQRQGEGSYPLQLSSDIVGFEGGMEEEEEESEEDGHDKGTSQAVQGQQKVQGSSLSLYSTISVRYEEDEESEEEGYGRGKGQVVEGQQEVQESCSSKFSSDTVREGGGGEQEHEAQAEESPSGLIFHQSLSKINLVVNWEYRFLICEVCKEGIEKKEIKGHLKQTHKEEIFKVNYTHLAKVIES